MCRAGGRITRNSFPKGKKTYKIIPSGFLIRTVKLVSVTYLCISAARRSGNDTSIARKYIHGTVTSVFPRIHRNAQTWLPRTTNSDSSPILAHQTSSYAHLFTVVATCAHTHCEAFSQRPYTHQASLVFSLFELFWFSHFFSAPDSGGLEFL